MRYDNPILINENFDDCQRDKYNTITSLWTCLMLQYKIQNYNYFGEIFIYYYRVLAFSFLSVAVLWFYFHFF